MKFKIIMKEKITGIFKNESIQDLPNEASVWIFIDNNPSTFSEFDCEIVAYAEPIANISPRQLRLALLESGITEAIVDNAIAGLSSPDKEAAYISWKYSTYFKRDEPAVAIVGALLELTSQQLDSLWLLASGK